MTNLYPIGSEIMIHGLRWRVVGHKTNAEGKLVEDVVLSDSSASPMVPKPISGVVPSAFPMNQLVPEKPIKINDTTSISVSRNGRVSMSVQIAPGLNIIAGGGRGLRLDVNMGKLKFSRNLKKR